jgi:hypothetical protein
MKLFLQILVAKTLSPRSKVQFVEFRNGNIVTLIQL